MSILSSLLSMGDIGMKSPHNLLLSVPRESILLSFTCIEAHLRPPIKGFTVK